MTRLEVVVLTAKLIILGAAFAIALSLLCTNTIIEHQQQILTQQALILENINGINRNLNNLGIHNNVAITPK